MPEEIEDALAELASSFPAICTLETFPEKSVEGRDIHFIKLASGSGPDRPRVLLVGGVHARESAPPDALVRFAQSVLTSYSTMTDIVFGPASCTPLTLSAIDYPQFTISASTVSKILTRVDVYIAPLINPDGRLYDQLNPDPDPAKGGWRKNRRPDSDPARVGVDINRNHDIGWRFEDYYDMQVYRARYRTGPASLDPSDLTYRGPSAASEPETRNVQWIVDNKRINYFVDIHTFGRHILLPWGIEYNGTDPTMTFSASSWNGRRDGLPPGDPMLPPGRPDYHEFVPNVAPHFLVDRTQVAGTALRNAILRSAGIDPSDNGSFAQRLQSTYKVGQTAGLYLPDGGPLTGASDDFAFRRQFDDPSRAPLFAFAMEVGHAAERGFHPSYASPPGHYAKIERETHAALTELCAIAAHGLGSYLRPGIPLASLHQTDDQVDVFGIDFSGALNVTWFIEEDRWHGPARISPTGIFPRRAGLACVRQGDDRLDVFGVDNDGMLRVVWVVETGAWQGPDEIGEAGRFPPGSQVAAIRQTPEKVDVYVIDNDGALNVSWVVKSGGWNGPARISPTGRFPRSAHVTACHQADDQVDVFAIDNDGALNVTWFIEKDRWHGPERISPPGYFPPGAPVTAIRQTEEKLDVYAVDTSAALNVSWVVKTGGWNGPARISPTGRFPRGAHVTACHQTEDQVDVFAVDVAGALNVTWFLEGDRWYGPATISGFDYFPPGAGVSVTPQTEQKLDVYAVDTTGALNVSWVVETGGWNGPARISAGLSRVEPDSSVDLGSSPWPTVVFGQPVTFTATVEGADTSVPPTGSVTLRGQNLSPRRVPVINGKATAQVADLPAGLHQITADYSGDSSFGPSQRSTLQNVERAQTKTALAGRLMIRGTTPF